MTLQSSAPLVHQSLDASARQARELARLHRTGELILDAPYQRGAVWSTDQRRNLIRSWLLGLPIPAIILNDRGTESWAVANGAQEQVYAVIDGKQRLESAIAWFTGQLDVPASWFEPDAVERTRDTDDGPYVTFDELTLPGQRWTTNRALLPVASAKVSSVAAEAVIFGLVNGAGVPQDEDTLERARSIAAGEPDA